MLTKYQGAKLNKKKTPHLEHVSQTSVYQKKYSINRKKKYNVIS